MLPLHIHSECSVCSTFFSLVPRHPIFTATRRPLHASLPHSPFLHFNGLSFTLTVDSWFIGDSYVISFSGKRVSGSAFWRRHPAYPGPFKCIIPWYIHLILRRWLRLLHSVQQQLAQQFRLVIHWKEKQRVICNNILTRHFFILSISLTCTRRHADDRRLLREKGSTPGNWAESNRVTYMLFDFTEADCSSRRLLDVLSTERERYKPQLSGSWGKVNLPLIIRSVKRKQ